MADFEFDPDDDEEDRKLHWEEEAEKSLNQALGDDVEFDHERGLVRIGDNDEWLGPDDYDSLVSNLAEAYDEQWYANVPFESGTAVFESDSLYYAGERLSELGITDFFDKVTERRPRKFVLLLAERSESAILLPTDSLLPLQSLATFTSDQIAELQDLINSPSCKESDLQKFFQKYPHFLSRWDCSTILPQVHLPRSGGNLIPDFLLCNPKRHRSALIDLKLPKEKLVRRQKNRLRWSGAVAEAQAQLTTYRRWFDDETHRQLLLQKTGMPIYRPSLAVIIGRFSEFKDPLDRQQLQDDMRDVEIITYDDISDWAEKRKVD